MNSLDESVTRLNFVATILEKCFGPLSGFDNNMSYPGAKFSNFNPKVTIQQSGTQELNYRNRQQRPNKLHAMLPKVVVICPATRASLLV